MCYTIFFLVLKEAASYVLGHQVNVLKMNSSASPFLILRDE